MTKSHFLGAIAMMAVAGLGPSCSSVSGNGRRAGAGTTGGASGGDNSGTGASGTGGIGTICLLGCDGGGMVVPPGCGDSLLGADEACDDGNRNDGDGCSSDCKIVDPAYLCVVPGRPCFAIAKCGDGAVTPPELCDDGNTAAGDGCSPDCSLELNYKCSGSPSVCSRTVCGDNVVEGGESCDVGDILPYDGCSMTCHREPNCTAGACKSECGDFLVVDEECDDGNDRSGDGCSSTCKVEPGWTCQQTAVLGPTLDVPIVYRDFYAHDDPVALRAVPSRAHPNFHWAGLPTATTRIVQPLVDAQGKPQFLGPPTGADWQVGSQVNFSTWYRPSALAFQIAETLTLRDLTGSGQKYTFEDTTFFPLDGRGWVADPAFPETLYQGQPDPVTPNVDAGIGITADGGIAPGVFGFHNFFFTSELRYWIKYDPAANATLAFRGDDDVWVFVAGRLMLDLGGIHDAVAGNFTLNAATRDARGAALNLTPGSVYEISVFQAERNPGASNYMLELGAFNPAPSRCTPRCGDGILTLGEQCDDGVNEGGYNKCGPDCKLSLYCGDGIVTRPQEDCDDGNRVNGDACNNACRILVLR